ncbi:hypothetical protein Agabi119p4_11653 [Agaricus bisporus var. burnettii]|uniref:Reverse transcriptase Ty1/copia-type domain-containing protein n=1 Tax=Agaricus bisporus var. burnettii TaxID=192524 RepID=A0A8H7C0E2_AGABI|nr:hypothetical protein Agabi119p4_11653 [Agaricus bisporus var. burnettii]
MWMDNILGASSTEEGELVAKDDLRRSYELKDLGAAKFILGMKIHRDEETGSITLSQHANLEQILKHFHMQDAKFLPTLLKPNITLSADNMPQTEEKELDMKNVPYRKALGSLMLQP